MSVEMRELCESFEIACNEAVIDFYAEEMEQQELLPELDFN